MPAPIPVAGLQLSAIADSPREGLRVLCATLRASPGFAALFAAVALSTAPLPAYASEAHYRRVFPRDSG